MLGHARHAGLGHDAALNSLTALHDETRRLDPEPSGMNHPDRREVGAN